MSNLVLETLEAKRNQLITEMDELCHRLSTEIKSIEMAMEIISGKKVADIVETTRYDDENPHYIKGTEDGI